MSNSSAKKWAQIALASLALWPVGQGAFAQGLDLMSLKDADGSEDTIGLSIEDRQVKLDGIATNKDVDYLVEHFEGSVAKLGAYQLDNVSRSKDNPGMVLAHFYLEGETEESWDTKIFLLIEDMPKRIAASSEKSEFYALAYISTFSDSIYNSADMRLKELRQGEDSPLGVTIYSYPYRNGDTDYAMSLIWQQEAGKITNLQFIRHNEDGDEEHYSRFDRLLDNLTVVPENSQ